MSQENVEMVRRAYEAFSRGDWDAVDADFASDFEYVSSGSIPGVEGVYRGWEGFRRVLESFWGEFDESVVVIRELVDAEDQVLAGVTFQGRGKQSGIETTWDAWQVWTVRGGKAVRGQMFTSRQPALEAAGLSE